MEKKITKGGLFMERRDVIRLKKIVDYCEDITGVLESFGDEQNVFFCNLMFQKVIAFDIFQIGELVATLTDEFKRNRQRGVLLILQ